MTSWQTEGEKVGAVTDFVFLGSKLTVDGDRSHEIKRHVLLRIKVRTNYTVYSKAETSLYPQRSI